MNNTAYDSDYYAWTQAQAKLLRDGKLAELDLGHLAEEIEDMGKSEKRALESRLEILLIHLLKWQFQAAFRGMSWELTIKEQRKRLAKHLKENPSLTAVLAESISDAYELAVIGATKETGLRDFPETCPYTLEQIFNPDFFPD
jgi:hypothetical protein